jgi:hypothetical protein
VPQDFEGCHTTIIGGHVVEGHVPADIIHRLLKERPELPGISLPGMTDGSPGMPGEKGSFLSSTPSVTMAPTSTQESNAP